MVIPCFARLSHSALICKIPLNCGEASASSTAFSIALSHFSLSPSFSITVLSRFSFSKDCLKSSFLCQGRLVKVSALKAIASLLVILLISSLSFDESGNVLFLNLFSGVESDTSFLYLFTSFL
uniref:Uncharacterized protein n=1 Tax=Pararge aegeria TaxID=116150 RepID=S4PQT9_9NEOP